MPLPPHLPLPQQEQVLAERYRIVDILGEGGMGVVYRAQDLSTGRIVALKTLRLHSPAELFRLKHEFRALLDIEHPNLVRLHELTVAGDTCFFTMEYVDGVDFLHYVRRGHSDDESTRCLERCRAALRQLTAALQVVHAHGKVHRDIKPSNVLVDTSHRLVLLDFGLVRDVTSTGPMASSSGNFAGTLAYMAPEVVHGMRLTPAADWYSVGVMLYEALTGRLPFHGSAVGSLVERGRRRPGPLRALAPDVPGTVETLVMELLEPLPSKRAGAEAILACVGEPRPEEGPAASPRTTEFTFVGRAAELDVLRATLAASRAGTVAAVMVEGPSGIGKTSLVQQAVVEFESRQRALILRSVCRPREHVPFKALDGALDGLGQFLARQESQRLAALLPRHAAALGRVFPVLGRAREIADGAGSKRLPPEPQELRRVAFAALRELIARLADTRPVVLWIDDLHWGDLDSVLLLRELLRPPDAPAVLLICSFRGDDLRDTPLRAAMTDELFPVLAHRRELSLAPLSSDESRRLTMAILGDRATGFVDHIVNEGAGIPFFLTELSYDLRAPSRESTGPLPALDDLLARRIDRLSEPARRLLEVLAVAGHPLGETVAATAAGVGSQYTEHVAILQALRMVRSVPVAGGVSLTTCHDRIRQMMLARTPATQRSTCHARIAGALEGSPSPDPEALVDHYAEAGRLQDAAGYAYAAAEKAAQALAFNRAGSLYRRVIDLGGTEHPHWLLYERLGDTLINAGYGAKGGRTLLAAADALQRDGGDLLAVLRLKRRAAEFLLRAYCREEGLAVMREVLAAFDLPFPSSTVHALLSMLGNRVRWRFLRRFGHAVEEPQELSVWARERLETCWSAGVGFSIFDIFRAADCQARHALLAWHAGDPRQLARAVSAEAQILSWEGGATKRRRAAELHREAARITRDLDDPQVEAHRILMICLSAFSESSHRDVIAAAEDGIQLCRERCLGRAWELASLQVLYASSLILQGDFGRLWQLFPAMLREADDRDDRFASVMLRIGILNAAWLSLDQPDVARAQLAAATSDAVTNPWMVYQGRYAQAQIALYTGRPADAWADVTTALRILRRSHMLRMMVIREGFYEIFIRTAIALSATLPRSAERTRLLRKASPYIRRMTRDDAPGSLPRIDALRAAMHALQGDQATAQRELERAAAGFDDLDEHVLAAAARYALGGLVRGAYGEALRREAQASMRERGVVDPPRFAALLIPAFAALPSR